MSPATRQVVHRTDLRLSPDPTRVLARLFVPGHEFARDQESRTSGVLARALALDEADVVDSLERVFLGYAGRHRDLRAVLERNFTQIEHRLASGLDLSAPRRLLIGAYFTHEYAVEAAALFNPSVVAHPDQTGLAPGAIRFVLSLRSVGEGHISSLQFRTGVAGPGHQVRLDAAAAYLDSGRVVPTTYDRELVRAKLAEAHADPESASFLFERLPARFDDPTLEAALTGLAAERLTRHGWARTEGLIRRIVACNYRVDFDAATPLTERLLWPHAPSEINGIEDARFVYVDSAVAGAGRDGGGHGSGDGAGDGAVDGDSGGAYYATYTAFDGAQVSPQLIRTTDFRRFELSQMTGPAAKNKGMALFPRTIAGRFVALSRSDRESNGIATSTDGRTWGAPTTVQVPEQGWELIQLGNAGSPVETPAGWLVLTHGVGPMREYCLGAMLLDLEDPTRVLATLREPLLCPDRDERDGYVPNVVYSCGSLRVGDELLLPYGVSDSSVRFAYVDLAGLLGLLGDQQHSGRTRARTQTPRPAGRQRRGHV